MGIVVTVASLMLLAGCSSVPDAVNPVEWYRGAANLFDEEETPASGRPTESQAGKSQTDGQAYPNLGSVPARPADISTPSERRATRQGLVADRDQARYTDQQPANAIGADTSLGTSPGTPRTASAAAPAQTAAEAPPAASPTPPPASTMPPAKPAETAPPAPSAPPAARIAPRAEPTESRSAGTAMLERRRQEVLAERAAAAAAADESKPPQAPAAAPQPSAPQPSIPAASTEPVAEPRTRTVADIYREQFARSASPVATRSAEPAPSATPSRAAQDTAAPAVSDKAGISYLAATILFDHGSTTLDPAGRDSVRKVAADYRKTGGTLRVVGHASSRTTDMRPLQHQLANFQVSVSRAEAVAQELARLGVPRNAMQVAGVGDSQPIYYEVMPAGESGNRRVEIFVDY